jgi:hypothetical protein
MAPAGVDRRRDKRLQLALPVKFSAKPEDHVSLHSGVTHNVSSGGVYFEAGMGQFEPENPLWVRIGVPAHQGQDDLNLTLVSAGTVRRVERLDDERMLGTWPETQKKKGVYGIALQFDQRPTIQLHSFEELLWEDRQQ